MSGEAKSLIITRPDDGTASGRRRTWGGRRRARTVGVSRDRVGRGLIGALRGFARVASDSGKKVARQETISRDIRNSTEIQRVLNSAGRSRSWACPARARAATSWLLHQAARSTRDPGESRRGDPRRDVLPSLLEVLGSGGCRWSVNVFRAPDALRGRAEAVKIHARCPRVPVRRDQRGGGAGSPRKVA